MKILVVEDEPDLAAGLEDDLVMDQGGESASLPTKNLARGDVLKLKKEMVRRFYLRPRYLWDRVKRAQSPRELFGQAREGVALLRRNL